MCVIGLIFYDELEEEGGEFGSTPRASTPKSVCIAERKYPRLSARRQKVE